jgi:hypothetical protein
MTRSTNKRARLGSLLAMALGALALLAMPGIAAAKDHNRDRIPDRWEKRHHLSLQVNQSHRDQDGDHLANLGEFKAGDNPRDDDSDGDGVIDGEENAGTIASFDVATGKLVIDLFGTETVTGLVTEQTRIKCEDEHAPDVSMRSHDGEGTEPGDDNGGHGGEPGDDNGGDNSGPGSANSGPSGHDDNGTGANCTVSDLIPGAVVQQAELQVEHGTATFDEVELAG